MSDKEFDEIKKWYELLGDSNPAESAKYEIENNTNMHSYKLFLTGAWKQIMSAIEGEENQHEALFSLCYYLSVQNDFLHELGVDEQAKQWGVFEITPDGKPGQRLDGLHYYMEDSKPK